jgi:hypothetical protein
MQKVSIRLPGDVIDAYDEAEGTRSAVLRRRLVEAVEDGEVAGVPKDLRTLVEREAAVDRGRLARKRGTFKQRCYDFYRDKWDGGAVTPEDAESLAESWEAEAAIYGPESVAFVDAVLDWYRERWAATNRAGFPDPGVFVARADPDAVDVDARVVDALRDAAQAGIGRREAVGSVGKFHDETAVERAAAEVFDE